MLGVYDRGGGKGRAQQTNKRDNEGAKLLLKHYLVLLIYRPKPLQQQSVNVTTGHDAEEGISGFCKRHQQDSQQGGRFFEVSPDGDPVV